MKEKEFSNMGFFTEDLPRPKWKAKNKEGDWVKGSLFISGVFYYIIGEKIIECEYKDDWGVVEVRHEIDPHTLKLYTGYNFHGIEIYADDILISKGYKGEDEEIECIVKYKKPIFTIGIEGVRSSSHFPDDDSSIFSLDNMIKVKE